MKDSSSPGEAVPSRPPLYSGDGSVFDAALEAATYSFKNSNARGGGLIGKAQVFCEVLGLDPDMPVAELRRRLA